MNHYKNIDDLQTIVDFQISEGLLLEYKGSDIISKGKSDIICKAISALANSMGGQFIIGVESKNNNPFRLDGGVKGSSKRDWLFQIINAKTFPAVDSVDIHEICEPTGSYYVMTVPVSPQAPHQSIDHRYYKRHGSHSLPMEHYEVEDVRNRPKEKRPPLRVDLISRSGIGFLKLQNQHPSASLTNVTCLITSNVEFERDAINSLCSRGLRELRAQTEKYFLLDSIGAMLDKNTDAEFHVSLSFEYFGSTFKDFVTFYLGDLLDSAVVQSPSVDALIQIKDGVGRLAEETARLGHNIDRLSQIADGSGLRLSQRTLMALKDVEQKFDPNEFDWDGYSIVLDISSDEAALLHNIFGTLGSQEQKKANYRELPESLRNIFEKKFKVDWGEST